MANVIISPNMSLPVPVPGVDPGPDYANNLNSSLNIIDGHNHSPGSGVQITPQGLNIDSDLSIQNNNLTNVAGIEFSAPATSATLAYLYTNMQSGGGITDLFFNDGAGNVIPITKAGEVNAVVASIPGESYSAGTFTWKQGAGSTTPANFDIGSVTIRPNIPGTTFGVTLTPPSAISSAYDIALPTIPSQTSFVQLDSSGNLLATLTVDNSTIVISGNELMAVIPQQVPPGTVITYAGTATPSGYLLCDGTSYATTAQPALFAAVGYTYGGSGANFNLPNLQGIFIRGVGTQVIDGVTYTGIAPGTLENDAFEQHDHTLPGADVTASGAINNGHLTAGGPTDFYNYVTGPAGVGSETKPANMALYYLIKT